MKFRPAVRTATSPSGLDRADVFALWFFTVVTGVVGIIALCSAVPQIVSLFGDEIAVSVSASAAIPADAATGSASIVSGQFDSAALVVTGIDLWPRIALAASAAVTALSSFAVAATIVALCRAILVGRPFVRSMTWLLSTASIVLIGGSVIGLGLNTFAMFSIAEALNPDPVEAVFPLASEYDFAPLLIGLVLGAVATAFHLGQKMQRDTEGLV